MRHVPLRALVIGVFFILSAQEKLKFYRYFLVLYFQWEKYWESPCPLFALLSEIKRLGSPLANNTILPSLEKLPSVALANNTTLPELSD